MMLTEWIRGTVEQIVYRNELKYQCSEQQMRMLETRIKHVCRPDPHAGESGRYAVRSVYFDDYCDSCYYENEDGADNRKKFRIRIYDGNTAPIILECKEKRNGLGHKSACRIDVKQCGEIIGGSFRAPNNADPVLCKFFLYYRAKLYRPKVVVEYERTPFVYRAGNVRITFDRHIAATAHVEDFLNPRIHARPVMPAGMHLLEVKYDGLLPDHIYNELQLKDLQRTAYSKYYAARRFTKDFCI